MLVATMYVDKPQGGSLQPARPRTWMDAALSGRNFGIATGHAVQPRSRGRGSG